MQPGEGNEAGQAGNQHGNGVGQNKLSNDFIVKNSSGIGKNNNVSTTQDTGIVKAKLKNQKPVVSIRGKSVPQERPSNSQGGGGGGNMNNTQQVISSISSANHVGTPNQNSKSNSGIRISTHRQFISSSNKNIKTLKNFGQSGRH